MPELTEVVSVLLIGSKFGTSRAQPAVCQYNHQYTHKTLLQYVGLSWNHFKSTLQAKTHWCAWTQGFGYPWQKKKKKIHKPSL